MYAIDNLRDALEVTRDFLFPVQKGTWIKLAIVLLFVGGLTLGGPGIPPVDAGATAGDPQSTAESEAALEELLDEEFLEDVTMDELLFALLLIGAVMLGLWLVYALIGALLEFVFIESLRTKAVHVRQYTRENAGAGVQLFGFRLALALGMLVLLGVPAWLLVFQTDLAAVGILELVLGGLFALVALVATLVYGLLNRFTTVFVTQIMLLESRGILSAWKRFWPTLVGEWKEYAVYVVLIWILQLVVGIAFTIVAAIIFFSLIVLVAIVAVPIGLVAGPVAGIIVGLIGLAGILFAIMLVRVPIDTYFRYYEFLLLGDTNSDLDLIPDRRQALRAAAAAGAGDGRSDRADEWDRDDMTLEEWQARQYGDEWDDDARDDDSGWDDRSRWDEDSQWDDEDDNDDQNRGW